MTSAQNLLPAEGTLQDHIDSIFSGAHESSGTALRRLTYLRDLIATEREHINPSALAHKPEMEQGNWSTMICATLAQTLGASAPAWMLATRALALPWYPSESALLRRKAATSAPAYLRDLNIFVDANSLSRA